MQCQEFEDRMNLLLDERKSPEGDGALSAHAAGCEPCGRLLAGQRVLLAGLKRGKLPSASANFAQQVVSKSRQEAALAVVLDGPKSSRRAAWFVSAALLAAAAAALVAVSVAAWNSRGGNGNGSPNVVKNSVETPDKAETPEKNVVKPQPLVAKAAPSERRGPRATGRQSQPGSIVSLITPQGGYGVAIAEAASTLPEAVERIEEVERYAPGIRPIRVSFTMLLQAFWRAIPGSGASDAADPAAMQQYGVRAVV